MPARSVRVSRNSRIPTQVSWVVAWQRAPLLGAPLERSFDLRGKTPNQPEQLSEIKATECALLLHEKKNVSSVGSINVGFVQKQTEITDPSTVCILPPYMCLRVNVIGWSFLNCRCRFFLLRKVHDMVLLGNSHTCKHVYKKQYKHGRRADIYN